MIEYTIGFDMDKVLTNFEKAYNEQYREDQQFPQAGARFFDELEPIKCENNSRFEFNYDYIKHLESFGHNVYIVTAPSIPNLNCWTGKAVWIKKYLGEEYLKKTVMTYDKAVCSKYMDILIDDSIENGQLSFGEGLITYGSSKYNNMQKAYDQITEWSLENKKFNE